MEFFILLGLILLNGIFSMAEISLVSSRKPRLEGQAKKGDKAARHALEMANHPESFLSTVQVGITLIGIFTGIFSGEKIKGYVVNWLVKFDLLAPYASGLSTAIILILLTYFTLVLGELLPKRIGLSNPEVIAKRMVGPMQIMSNLTYPFIWILTKSTKLLGKLFNIRSQSAFVTEEEIKAIIDQGKVEGTIEEAEQDILERVFHLGDRNITSLMTHRSEISWLEVDTPLDVIMHMVKNSKHSVYPVCEKEIDNIKGQISIKDLYTNENNLPLRELVKPALFIPENNTAYLVLEKFKETKMHTCFVVDEYGTIQGMITPNDILEAIVGDIPEQEEESFEIWEREDGSYLVDGLIPFYNFLEYFDRTELIEEGEQEFDTLAGFILDELERIPHTGDALEWREFSFEIIDMDGHKIDKVMVKFNPE